MERPLPAAGNVVAFRPAGTARGGNASADRAVVAGLVRHRDELHAEALRLAESARTALDAAMAVQSAIEALGGEG